MTFEIQVGGHRTLNGRYTEAAVALVDDEDAPLVSLFRWSLARRGEITYAATGRVLMHRLLLPSTDAIDHRNGDGLDNRRENLRPASAGENMQNAAKHDLRTSSRYKGVCYHRASGKWEAHITIDKRKKYLGLFDTEIAAAAAYNSAALDAFGEFARPNRSLAHA